MAERVTLRVIADKVGVSKSTVSDVLRSRVGKVKISKTTKEKIFKAVRELNYEPNSAARALTTGKTYNIGFLLSSETTLGLANSYFATLMTGVQDSCKANGYNCLVSSYDMTTVKSFVVPAKLRRRNVDGLVLTGNIENEVLQTFIDSGLPFILVGENTDFPKEGILSVARDLVADWQVVFEHLYELGHRKIAVGGIATARGLRLFNKAVARFKQLHPDDNDLEFKCHADVSSTCDAFQVANNKAKEWLVSSDRPTAIVGHDQWCIGFMAGVLDGGCRCPEDLSVVCTCDTVLSQWCRPSLTSMSIPLVESGRAVTDLLIQYLEKKINWIDANLQAKDIWQGRHLVFRDSTGPAPE